MAGFAETLRKFAARVPETELVMIVGTDGIPVERLLIKDGPHLEGVAAEYTTLLRSSVTAAADTGLGSLTELQVATEKLVALMVAITPEYYLFAALSPGAVIGRARFGLRSAALALESEFL